MNQTYVCPPGSPGMGSGQPSDDLQGKVAMAASESSKVKPDNKSADPQVKKPETNGSQGY